MSGNGNKHAALASALGSLTWEKPSYTDFQQLAKYCIAGLYYYLPLIMNDTKYILKFAQIFQGK